VSKYAQRVLINITLWPITGAANMTAPAPVHNINPFAIFYHEIVPILLVQLALFHQYSGALSFAA
jgi:hypothetical protein